MGIHEPNFKVFFEYRSPVRATFELHMEVPLVPGNPESQPDAVAEAEQLVRHLNAGEWLAAGELLERKVAKDVGREVVRAVFQIRDKYPKEAS
jgi:hypothetical protein